MCSSFETYFKFYPEVITYSYFVNYGKEYSTFISIGKITSCLSIPSLYHMSVIKYLVRRDAFRHPLVNKNNYLESEKRFSDKNPVYEVLTREHMGSSQ